MTAAANATGDQPWNVEGLDEDLRELWRSYPVGCVAAMSLLVSLLLLSLLRLFRCRGGITWMVSTIAKLTIVLSRLLFYLIKGLVLELPLWTIKLHSALCLAALLLSILAHPLVYAHYPGRVHVSHPFLDSSFGVLERHLDFATVMAVVLLPGLVQLFLIILTGAWRFVRCAQAWVCLPCKALVSTVSMPAVLVLASVIFAGFGGGWLCVKVLALYLLAWAARPSAGRRPPSGEIIADDITRLNAASVAQIFYPRSVADVQEIVRRAHEQGLCVSMRGTKHSMGGQTIARDGFIIDMRWMASIAYDDLSHTVTVGPGAKWEAVIQYLNSFGMAPRTLQSYCSFSVGGTISVNAHGITSDFCAAESIVCLEYVDANAELQSCGPGSEVFRLICGGYGLFGVVCSVKLKAVPNVKMTFEMINTKLATFVPTYESILKDPSVEVKICRINLVSLDDIQLFVFRRSALPGKVLRMDLAEAASAATQQRTVSDLPDCARGQSRITRLMYKWVAPSTWGRRLRYLAEDLRGTPVTGLQHAMGRTGLLDRNVMIFETADPLAQLYNPIVQVDDTFVLQEYFVPHTSAMAWMQRARTTLRRITPGQHINLLNITIRYVLEDTHTFLRYAKSDVFAFVLYYRVRRTAQAEQELQKVHHEFADLALEMGGTFYLPYRHHYSAEQLSAAYPEVQAFFEKKCQLDPRGLFSNSWYEHYAGSLGVHPREPRQKRPKTAGAGSTNPRPEDGAEADGSPRPVPTRRSDSYTRVMQSDALRCKFSLFLQHVFNVESEQTIIPIVNRAIWSQADCTDRAVYMELCDTLASRRGLLRGSARAWRALQNLRAQREDFTKQVLSILAHAGAKDLHSICSIGDAGKIVQSVRQAYSSTGPTWLLHEPGPLDFIERNSLLPFGRIVRFQFRDAASADLEAVPTGSVDIALSMPGLHHIQPGQLGDFLQFIYRILRPGGLLIFREHDGSDSLKPLLDVAHSVFDAVTGVPPSVDDGEIRAFRSLEGWRHLVSAQGFEDMMLYEVDELDPTEDVMLCFRKPGSAPTKPSVFQGGPGDEALGYYKWSEWILVEFTRHFAAFMETNVWYRFPYLEHCSLYWSLTFEAWAQVARASGLRRAFSFGLLMDVIIGIVSTLLFLLLWLLALPLRMVRGDKYHREVETLVVHSGSTEAPPAQLSGLTMRHPSTQEILGIRCVPLGAGIYCFTVPSQLAFTEALRQVAGALPTGRLLEVTGCGPSASATLRVAIAAQKPEEVLQWLRTLPGLEVLHTFRLPAPPRGECALQAILRASVQELLQVVRKLAAADPREVSLVQVFDFGLQKEVVQSSPPPALLTTN